MTRRAVDPGPTHFRHRFGDRSRGRSPRRQGVAVQVDHSDDHQVAELFERVRSEHGTLDILVNNAFALPDNLTEPAPFWEKPLSNSEMVDVGVRSNFVGPGTPPH